MRSWLKALVVLVALAAGFPAAAWAHAGHDHEVQPASPHAVSSAVAVVPAMQAIDSRDFLTHRLLTADGFIVSIALPSSWQRILRAGDRVDGSPLDRVGSELDAMPADLPVDPVHQKTCCCGSLACHAGMAAPTATVIEPWTFAAKVELPPVLALAGAVPGGIERPPRGSFPL